MPLSDEEQARLRAAEMELVEFRTKVESMAADVSNIRKYIEKVSEESARLDNLDKLEASVDAAHRRLDAYREEMLKLQLEHAACQRVKEGDKVLLEGIRDGLNKLKIQFDAMAKDKAEHDKDEEKAKGFWKERLTKLVDIAIPATIGFIIATFLHVKEAEKHDALLLKSKSIQQENIQPKSVDVNDRPDFVIDRKVVSPTNK